MEGRGSGTAGAERAARHIADVFRAAGLRPGGDGGRTYLQSFTVPTGTRLGRPSTRWPCSHPRPGRSRSAPTSRRWPSPPTAPPRARSCSPATASPRPICSTTTTPGSTTRDRIVIVLTRRSARGRSGQPVPPARGVPLLAADAQDHQRPRARRARDPARRASARARRAPALRGLSQDHGILAAVRDAGATADALLAPSGGTWPSWPPPSIARWRRSRSRWPRRPGPLRGHAGARARPRTANVDRHPPGRRSAAARRGHRDRRALRSPRPRRRGLAGARVDRPGPSRRRRQRLRHRRSCWRSPGRSPPSGPRPRTLVFVAFAGEELGLLGSAHYVTHPPLPLERTVLMVNVDMVGRLRGHRLYVGGVDSGTGLRAVVNDAAQGLGLSLELRAESVRRRRITRRSTRRAARSCSSSPARTTTTTGPATRGTRSTRRAWPPWPRSPRAWSTPSPRAATPPAYVKVDAPPATAGPRGSGYGAYFGVVPEFGGARRWLRPACASAACGRAVRRRRPACRAATSSSASPASNVRTLEDFTFALRGRRAGDQVAGRRPARRRRAAAAGRARGATLMSLRDSRRGLARPRGRRRARRLHRRGRRWRAPTRASRHAVAVDPRERRLANLRQLTTSGQNAEAYFDWTGTRLIFQSTRPPYGCDQIFTMKTDGSDVRLVSTGRGRTTCGFFFPDGRRLIYASTHLARRRLPAPARSRQRLRVADLSELRDRLRRRRRRQSHAPHRLTTATTPRAPSRPTAGASSSRRCATATSIST